MNKLTMAFVLAAGLFISGSVEAAVFFEFRIKAPVQRGSDNPEMLIGGHIAISDEAYARGISISKSYSAAQDDPAAQIDPAYIEWWKGTGLLWLDMWAVPLDEGPVTQGVPLSEVKDSFRLDQGPGFRFVLNDLRDYVDVRKPNDHLRTTSWSFGLQSSAFGMPRGGIDFYYRLGTGEQEIWFLLDFDGANSSVWLAADGAPCYSPCTGPADFFRSNRTLPIPEPSSHGALAVGLLLLILTVATAAPARTRRLGASS